MIKSNCQEELVGCVFDIQHYCIHDGPGLRTLVFLKGCPLRCIWCSNPESQLTAQEIGWHQSRCIGCYECVKVCPNNSIGVVDGKIAINRATCNSCGKCVDICPGKALRLYGRQFKVSEVVKEVEKDLGFYEDEGGVTLTGGEPLLQAEFARAVLKECKEMGIGTAVETTGCVQWPAIEQVIAYTDIFLYDLKHLDSNKHREFTGVGNEVIVENLTKADRAGAKIRVRFPFIPGINDGQNIQDLIQYCHSINNLDGIDILPYHKLGENKYRALGRQYQLANLQPPKDDVVLHIKGLMEEAGFKATIGGN